MISNNYYPQGLNQEIVLELENLGPNGIKKRVTRELLELQNKGAYISVEYNTNYNNITYINNKHLLTINIVLAGTDDLITFEICRDYPFKGPTNIKINYKPYSSFLRINQEKTLNEVKLMYFNFNKNLLHCCLSCSSITCPERWSPPVKLIHILEEIQEYKNLRRSIINKLLAYKILNRYLMDDNGFHNYFYSFLIPLRKV